MGSGRGVQRDRDDRSREVQRAVTVRSMRSSISLFAGRASLLRIKKFPVRVHGNLLAKWLTLRGFLGCGALKKCPEMRNFPVICRRSRRPVRRRPPPPPASKSLTTLDKMSRRGPRKGPVSGANRRYGFSPLHAAPRQWRGNRPLADPFSVRPCSSPGFGGDEAMLGGFCNAS
jgi:hypothetical protein